MMLQHMIDCNATNDWQIGKTYGGDSEEAPAPDVSFPGICLRSEAGSDLFGCGSLIWLRSLV